MIIVKEAIGFDSPQMVIEAAVGDFLPRSILLKHNKIHVFYEIRMKQEKNN